MKILTPSIGVLGICLTHLLGAAVSQSAELDDVDSQDCQNLGLPEDGTDYPPGMPWYDYEAPFDPRKLSTECDPMRYNWNEQFWEKRSPQIPQDPPEPSSDPNSVSRAKHGPINLQRYKYGMHHYGFPSFFKLPVAMSKFDLDPTLTGSSFKAVDVAIVGYPSDNYAMHGASFAPNAIRGLIDYHFWGATQDLATYTDQWLRVKPFSDLSVVDFGNIAVNIFSTEETVTEARRVILDILRGGAVPFVVGGNHDTQWPVILALAEKKRDDGIDINDDPIYLVHLDAHYDGAKAGLGTYVHNGNALMWGVRLGMLQQQNIVQIGLRSTSPDDAGLRWMQGHEDNGEDIGGIRYHFMAEYEYYKQRGQGFEGFIESVFKDVPRNADVYVSVDIDVMDQSFVPGTGGREAHGLTPEEVLRIVRGVAITNDIVAFDIAEYNPLLDDIGKTTGVLVKRIITTALAGMAFRNQYPDNDNPYMLHCDAIQNPHQERKCADGQRVLPLPRN
jgi:agmatinase